MWGTAGRDSPSRLPTVTICYATLASSSTPGPRFLLGSGRLHPVGRGAEPSGRALRPEEAATPAAPLDVLALAGVPDDGLVLAPVTPIPQLGRPGRCLDLDPAAGAVEDVDFVVHDFRGVIERHKTSGTGRGDARSHGVERSHTPLVAATVSAVASATLAYSTAEVKPSRPS